MSKAAQENAAIANPRSAKIIADVEELRPTNQSNA
jgi:hypothetical protein